jgi:hypothetical protein
MTDGTSQFTGEPTRPQLRGAAATFDLLSAPTRLHLMWLLARGEHDVGSLAARTGATVALVGSARERRAFSPGGPRCGHQPAGRAG